MIKFITTENELYPSTDGIIYFYSSDQISPVGELMFLMLSKLDKNYDIICIDLYYFNNLHKRFNIIETPTIIIMEDGSEIKRITGTPSINYLNNFLGKD